MTTNLDPSRRQFLSRSGKLVIGEALFSLAPDSAAAGPRKFSPRARPGGEIAEEDY